MWAMYHHSMPIEAHHDPATTTLAELRTDGNERSFDV
jgi:hypothetical protein